MVHCIVAVYNYMTVQIPIDIIVVLHASLMTPLNEGAKLIKHL